METVNTIERSNIFFQNIAKEMKDKFFVAINIVTNEILKEGYVLCCSEGYDSIAFEVKIFTPSFINKEFIPKIDKYIQSNFAYLMDGDNLLIISTGKEYINLDVGTYCETLPKAMKILKSTDFYYDILDANGLSVS